MILILGYAFRWSPLSSTYLRTSLTQVSTEVYHPDCHFHAFFSLFFASLPFLISRRSMLGECQEAILPFGIQRMCRSRRNRRNLCSCPFMVRDKYIFVEYCLDFLCKGFFWSCFLFFFSCGIFLQPKRVWKEKGHLGRLCCGDQARSGSKERLWYTDACCDEPDGSVHSNQT